VFSKSETFLYSVSSGDVKGALQAASSGRAILALLALTSLAFAVNNNDKYQVLVDGPLAAVAGLRWIFLTLLLVALGTELYKAVDSVLLFEGRRKM
jgi:hypothetical protein